MAVQQMSVLLLQIFCFLLSGSQEYGLIYAFWFLLFNIHPPLISYPKKTTLHIIKSKYFFFCSLLDQLMIIRKELTLVLNKKENYVNKNFSSAMPWRLMKLSGPICGTKGTYVGYSEKAKMSWLPHRLAQTISSAFRALQKKNVY